jgi:hypothetical protein
LLIQFPVSILKVISFTKLHLFGRLAILWSQGVKLAGEKIQIALVACATIVGYSATTSA